jgi:hypothetical protein
LLKGAVRIEPGETNNHEARTLYPTPQLLEALEMHRAIRDQEFPDCRWVFFRYGSRKPKVDCRVSWEEGSKVAGL